ncbi:hypothetical protein F5B18DRAFT_637589 [Nemania serpens]|nr:hypothetical protein F5B18DRAFT_637589 [Nemania serpens]
MDTNILAFRLLPAAGSERANPSSYDAGDWDVKIQRRLPYEGNVGGNDLNNGSWQPLYNQSDLPQHNVCRDYESQYYGHGPGSQSEDFTLSGFANPSLGSIPKTYQMPTNDFYPSLGEVDIPMGDTPVYVNQLPIRTPEETLPLMDSNSGNNLLQSASDIYTTALLKLQYEVDASQHDQSILSAFQFNNALSHSPEVLDSEESLDISSNYDTCFGVVSIVRQILQTFL